MISGVSDTACAPVALEFSGQEAGQMRTSRPPWPRDSFNLCLANEAPSFFTFDTYTRSPEY